MTISNSVIYSNTANSWGRGFGGGLFQFYGAIRLVNSSVLSNTAFVQRNGLALQPGDGWGGGIMANGDLTLENVVLQGNGNTSTAGGGLYFLGQGLTMTGCTVRGNQADAGGGALLGGGPGLIQNSRFESNSIPASVSRPDCGFYECGSGGGLYVMGPFDVVGSRFLSNTSTLHGGGVMVDGSSSYFANNVIEGNAVSTTYYLAMGGGIYFSYSGPTRL